MDQNEQLVDAVESCLPQTQCGLCDYAGCRPYATAIVTQGERIDRCLPGGLETLQEIGQIMQQDPAPYFAEMEQKKKPPLIAVIREEACIGCTKCLVVCPVDAIIGAAKQMHTIIQAACTGCELCIPVCPMDCIDLIEIAARNDVERKAWASQSKDRYKQHTARKIQQQKKQQQQHLRAKKLAIDPSNTIKARQEAIMAAVARVKAKAAQDKLQNEKLK